MSYLPSAPNATLLDAGAKAPYSAAPRSGSAASSGAL